MDRRRKQRVGWTCFDLFGDWLYAPYWKPGRGVVAFLLMFMVLVLVVILGEVAGGRW